MTVHLHYFIGILVIFSAQYLVSEFLPDSKCIYSMSSHSCKFPHEFPCVMGLVSMITWVLCRSFFLLHQIYLFCNLSVGFDLQWVKITSTSTFLPFLLPFSSHFMFPALCAHYLVCSLVAWNEMQISFVGNVLCTLWDIKDAATVSSTNLNEQVRLGDHSI